MKMKVEIDLDWIEADEEEGGISVDEIVKAELVYQIRNSIVSKCKADIEQKAKSAIDDAVKEAISNVTSSINEKAISFFNDWLHKEVVLTDKWGNKEQQASVEDIIKHRFEDMIENTYVDCSNGKILGRDSYSSSKMRLIDFLIGKMIDKRVSQETENLSRDIDAKIKTAVDRDVKDKVAAKFAELVLKTGAISNG